MKKKGRKKEEEKGSREKEIKREWMNSGRCTHGWIPGVRARIARESGWSRILSTPRWFPFVRQIDDASRDTSSNGLERTTHAFTPRVPIVLTSGGIVHEARAPSLLLLPLPRLSMPFLLRSLRTRTSVRVRSLPLSTLSFSLCFLFSLLSLFLHIFSLGFSSGFVEITGCFSSPFAPFPSIFFKKPENCF